MLPIPTRIRAVRENPESPFLDCYPGTPPETLAKIFASRTTVTPPTIQSPKEKPMLNFTNYDENLAAASKGVTKNHINGIGASDNPGRLVDVLETLELITPELAVPLKTIAAHGGAVKDFTTVSVYALDAKLRGTDATLEQRLAFKASLARHGLLTVPR
jgi:hypothetical protein